MSRRKLKARDKVTQKMSRDGLIERNNTTGEDFRVSRRESDFDIHGGDTPERELLSQAGTKPSGNTGRSKQAVYRQNEYFREIEASGQYAPPSSDSSLSHIKGQSQTETVAPESWHITAPQEKAHRRKKRASGKKKPKVNTRLAQNQPIRETAALISSDSREASATRADTSTTPVTPLRQTTDSYDKSRDPPEQTGNNGKFKTRDNTVLRHNETTNVTDDPPDSQLRFNHNGIDGSRSERDTQDAWASSKRSKRSSLSQVGKRSKSNRKQKKKSAYRHTKPAALQHEPKETAQNVSDTQNEPRNPEYTPVTDGAKNPNGTINTVQREQDLILRNGNPKNESLPNGVNKPDKRINQKKTSAYSHFKPSVLQHDPPKADSQLTFKNETTAVVDNTRIADSTETPPKPPDNPIMRQSNNGNFKILRDSALRHKPEQKTDMPVAEAKDGKPPYKYSYEQAEPLYESENADAAAITETTREASGNKPEPQSPEMKPAPKQDNADEQAETPDNDTTRDTEPVAAEPKAEAPETVPDTPLKHDKSGKLKFAEDEPPPEKPDKQTRKLVKAEKQAERAGEKLEKAKDNLPAKKKLRSERVYDEQKGKAKRRLYFEKEVKTQGQHLKGALPLRPVKAAGNTLMLNAHRKIYQVEHENVSVKAAHRAEQIAEGGVRSALRLHKTAPYRKVAKLEKQAAKKTIKLNYQKTLAENPQLSSNMLSRMMQKRKIKKDYAKAARDAKKTANAVKKAGSVTAKAAKLLAGAVRRHPIVTIVVVLLALLLFLFMSLFGLGSGIGGSSISAIITTSYLADDESIEKAELNYSEWETDLQYQIINAETSYPGYDEYRYNTGEISHNPFELMAYLTAVYQNFAYDAVSADLRALFDEQYTLTFTETIETRYADPTDADGDGDYEPYEWKVLTVTLAARSFTEVILPKMTAEQQQHYALLMQTKGNRQYAGNPFDAGWLPYVSSYYGWRVHPITGEKDLHRGVDIALPAGTEIHSAQYGTVTFAGNSGGYGNVVIIENDRGITTKYAHCDTLLVSAGQIVNKGDVIATVGNTGNSTGAHLHFEVMRDGEYLNPLIFSDTGDYNLLPVYGTPSAPMGDGSYAALIEEAERHLGKPYVFGANGPNSFDCSSYVCYVLTQSGVKNMPRTTAQGIYNQCVTIPASERQPGDLAFFHSTYSTPNTITHVAIYTGNGWIIHAGSPIKYTQIDGNAYWQAHLYSYGRLN